MYLFRSQAVLTDLQDSVGCVAYNCVYWNSVDLDWACGPKYANNQNKP